MGGNTRLTSNLRYKSMITEPASLPNDDYLRFDKIRRHATRAFLTQGYAATSVEDVALDASVSKATIYRLFDDKLGLAAAVMQGLADSLELYCQRAIDMASPPEYCLVSFATTYLNWMMMSVGTTKNYALTRLLIEMSSSHPDFSHTWIEKHQKVIATPLSLYIAEHIASGELSSEETPFFIASNFISSIIHTPGIIVMNEKIANNYIADIDELVKRKVRLFLQGARSRPV